ncbi:MAG TPA: methionine adenosyltransferase [Myxococcota bacterium]|nr:methionine adenosyltransferase [Myxococcota bacterium]HOS62901.1 methionine adenosyltransferase [Myxococcota bacterium]HPC93279.1 methionine adenosyltransferase [Myxococcota bacterium]HPL24852.1 methionine adenosyltransferase [Myxococcota bacterium]HRR74057.1 methionine adenosyltransferase [Myxococcota bacterium]
MAIERHVFSSESVTEGHPDKVADQISDAILDAILEQDKDAHVACETMVTTGMAIVAGEISTNCWVDIPAVVRKTIEQIGYNDPAMGFDSVTCAVITSIDKQSGDIAMGVNRGSPEEQGAGDQGMMFGYATNETPELMPMSITVAQQLTKRLAEVRKTGLLPFVRPDGKSQVSVVYEDGKAIGINAVVLSTQHSDDVTLKTIREALIEEVIKPVIPEGLLLPEAKIFVNPTGRFVIGGPMGDCGLTGRKIIVDSYGGVGRHGGGCFSGKDPSKVDRSGAYYGRYVAKNIVAAGLADRCEVQTAYAIGVAQPVSVFIDTKGTEKIPVERIRELVMKHFDFRPGMIVGQLDLLRPIYLATAAYGHFGRNEETFTWERTDRAAALKADA